MENKNTFKSHSKNKILSYKPTKTCTGLVCLKQNADERNQNSYQMERHPLFMDGKIQHSKDVSSPQNDT